MAGTGGPAVAGRRALGRGRLAARRPRRARGGRGAGERAGRLGGRAAPAGVRAGVAANMGAGAATTGSGAGVAAPRGVVPPSWCAHRAPPFTPSTDGAAPGPGLPRSRAARGSLVRRPRARPSEAGRDRFSRSHGRKDRPRPPYPSSPRRAPPSPRRSVGAGAARGRRRGRGQGASGAPWHPAFGQGAGRSMHGGAGRVRTGFSRPHRAPHPAVWDWAVEWLGRHQRWSARVCRVSGWVSAGWVERAQPSGFGAGGVGPGPGARSGAAGRPGAAIPVGPCP